MRSVPRAPPRAISGWNWRVDGWWRGSGAQVALNVAAGQPPPGPRPGLTAMAVAMSSGNTSVRYLLTGASRTPRLSPNVQTVVLADFSACPAKILIADFCGYGGRRCGRLL